MISRRNFKNGVTYCWRERVTRRDYAVIDRGCLSSQDGRHPPTRLSLSLSACVCVWVHVHVRLRVCLGVHEVFTCVCACVSVCA
jgi:hypothetical protein